MQIVLGLQDLRDVRCVAVYREMVFSRREGRELQSAPASLPLAYERDGRVCHVLARASSRCSVWKTPDGVVERRAAGSSE